MKHNVTLAVLLKVLGLCIGALAGALWLRRRPAVRKQPEENILTPVVEKLLREERVRARLAARRELNLHRLIFPHAQVNIIGAEDVATD